MLPEIRVRLFDDLRDRSAVTSIYARTWPWPIDESRLEEWDRQRIAAGSFIRWVATVDTPDDGGVLVETVVGFAEIYRDQFHAIDGHYAVNLGVFPGYRRLGVGTKLADTLLNEVTRRQTERLITYIPETYHNARRLAERYGLKALQTEYEYVLDLDRFSLDDWADKLVKPRQHGIQLRSFPDVSADPDADWRIWNLDQQLYDQIPDEDDGKRPDFAEWRERRARNTACLDEGSFVAVAPDGRFVGLTTLTADPGGESVLIDLTGVLPSARRMGIATALKLTAMQWAKEQGYQRIRTLNDACNTAIVSLNERLGFERSIGWVTYHVMIPTGATPATLAMPRASESESSGRLPIFGDAHSDPALATVRTSASSGLLPRVTLPPHPDGI